MKDATEVGGYFGWLLADGVERVTVDHLAVLGRKRRRDVLFILSCEGVPVDDRLGTVAIRDLVKADLV